MTKYLDADVTIAYVRELAQAWRREEAQCLRTPSGRWVQAQTARGKAICLEDLAQQLDQQAVKVA